jgi:TonB family protein
MWSEAAREKTRKTAYFLFSVALHAVFFSVLFNLRYTVTIYEEAENVRNVVIVPQDKIKIPRNIENLISQSPSEVHIIGRRSESVGGNIPAAAGSGVGGQESTAGLEAVSDSEGTLPVPQVRLEPSPFFLFNLDWSSRLKSVETKEPDLILSLPARKEADFSEKTGSSSTGDLRRYLNGGGRIQSSIRPGGEAKGFKIPESLALYDLSPWAEQVIGRIQNLWRLDAAQTGEPRGSVELKIVIGKDGSLKSIDVIRSSDDEGLDRAAVRAVESNLPLPVLPADFPLDRLEFRLVFEYDY